MNKSSISNMKELDAAQLQLRRELGRKKESLGKSIEKVKEFYTPGNLVNSVVGDIIPLFDWRVAALALIRSIRTKINRK